MGTVLITTKAQSTYATKCASLHVQWCMTACVHVDFLIRLCCMWKYSRLSWQMCGAWSVHGRHGVCMCSNYSKLGLRWSHKPMNYNPWHAHSREG